MFLKDYLISKNYMLQVPLTGDSRQNIKLEAPSPIFVILKNRYSVAD